MFGFLKRKITLEEQLKNLSHAGITLRQGVTEDILLESFSKETYEKGPYRILLIRMGGEREREPFDRISDNIWLFDTECIEDNGSYVIIAERFRAMAGNGLPLENIRDHVDLDNDEAWLEFSLDGKDYHWDAFVEDNWADTDILCKFAVLLEERKCGKGFVYLDLGGQDCLLGCITTGQMDMLKKVTGLSFVWLRSLGDEIDSTDEVYFPGNVSGS